MLNSLDTLSSETITKAIASFPEVEKAVLFGSRAKGTNKPGSDIDIAIKGEKCSIEIAWRLNALLNEELPLPYFFDIVHYESITNQALKQHIDRVGKVIYLKD
jgi:uncharacterized protein